MTFNFNLIGGSLMRKRRTGYCFDENLSGTARLVPVFVYLSE